MTQFLNCTFWSVWFFKHSFNKDLLNAWLSLTFIEYSLAPWSTHLSRLETQKSAQIPPRFLTAHLQPTVRSSSWKSSNLASFLYSPAYNAATASWLLDCSSSGSSFTLQPEWFSEQSTSCPYPVPWGLSVLRRESTLLSWAYSTLLLTSSSVLSNSNRTQATHVILIFLVATFLNSKRNRWN